MGSSSSETSESQERVAVSTNPSTPQSESSIDLPKLAREIAADVHPVIEVKNICCVGAGYVGMV